MIIDWYRLKRPSLVGVCVGAIAGLATITPCAGFVRPWAAFVIGILASCFCCEHPSHRRTRAALPKRTRPLLCEAGALIGAPPRPDCLL